MDSLVKDFDRFKQLFNANDIAGAKTQLSHLKVELAKFNFLVPQQLDNARFLLAREILEYAVLLSVKEKDSDAFERNFAQLKTYYNDTRNVAASDRRGMLLGLNLLRLLAYNRISDFHVELETIPVNLHSENIYIRHSLSLEQFLMEGSYNKLFEARAAVPAECYSHFMDILMTTTRSEIASCLEKAYRSLKLQEAQKLLHLASPAETREFCTARKWTVAGDQVQFVVVGEAPKKQTIPSLELIHQTLGYAKELERIV